MNKQKHAKAQAASKAKGYSPLYIRFNKRAVVRTEEFNDGAALIDYDKNGRPIGIELLGGFQIEIAKDRTVKKKT